MMKEIAQSSLRRNVAFAATGIDRDVGQHRFGHLNREDVMRPALGKDLDRLCHRRPADLDDLDVVADHIADRDCLFEKEN